MRNWMRALSVLTLMPFAAGCYAYSQVDRGAVAPGTTVRIALDRQEAIRQVDLLGGLMAQVEGRVTDATDASTLALTVRRSDTPAQAGRFNNYVTVPWTSVMRVEVKRFDAKRTVALAAGVTAVAAVTLSVLEGSSDPANGEDPSTNNAVRIPLLRIRW